MKKSISTNDTITFCHNLEQMIENCGLFVKYDAAHAARFILSNIQKICTRNHPEGYLMLTQCEYC